MFEDNRKIILLLQVKTFQTTASFNNSLNKVSILNERLNNMRFSTTNKGRAFVYLMSPSYLLRFNDIFHLSIYAYTFASLEVPERNCF